MDTAADDLRLLRAQDLAALWQVDASTIYRLVQSGQLAGVRVGRSSIRIRAADAMEYIRRQLPAPVPVDGWSRLLPAYEDAQPTMST